MNATDSTRATRELAYEEVTRSHQAITDFRAKLLGLLPLASGVGFFVVLGDNGNLPPDGGLAAIGLFGFAVTLGLFIYELRGMQQCHRLRRQAAKLECLMEFEPGTAPFLDRADEFLGGFAGAVGAGWIVYTAVMTSWLYVAGRGVTLGDAEVGLWEGGRGFLLAVGYVLVLVLVALYLIRTADEKRSRCGDRPSGESEEW